MSDDLIQLVADAYEHLYDLVYLRNHPLAEWFCCLEPTSKARAWRLHHLLLDAVKEMDPGINAPAFSREWRRYRLMVLRYVDGLDVQQIAERLACSRRTYYRELGEAMAAVATVVEDRFEVIDPAILAASPGSPADRLELLRSEAAQMAQSSRRARLVDVVSSALQLISPLASAHEMAIVSSLDAQSADMDVDWNTVRQIVLGVLGHILGCLEGGEINVRIVEQKDSILLMLRGSGTPTDAASDPEEMPIQLPTWQELAMLQEARLEPLAVDEQGLAGYAFGLMLPRSQPRVVLVADDNEDTLQLHQRYLLHHGYRVAFARTGSQTLALARQLRPYAIILDLMMPGQDGWDVLQSLLNHAQTHDIPVLVCSVLSARELALSLGAARFLPKPASEDVLIGALKALEHRD